MPPERHLAFGSNFDEPAMRDFRMTAQVAKYSVVSLGAFSGRPAVPSSTCAGRVGGRPPARPRPARPHGATGEYTPVKSGRAVPSARSDAVDMNMHTSAEEYKASKVTVFDMMSSRLITGPPAAPAARPRCHQRG